MSVKLSFRKRAIVSASIQETHNAFMERLQRAGTPWWLTGVRPSAPEIGDGLEAQVRLSEGLPAGGRGYAAYPIRSADYLRDESLSDDRLILEFEEESVPFGDLVRSGFPRFVDAFCPYRAGVSLNEELALDDWDRAIELGGDSGLDEDGRDTVLRFGPANYFDAELCRRAFSSSPPELCKRLAGHCERVEILHNGLLLIATSRALTDRESLLALDAKIKKLLNIESRI